MMINFNTDMLLYICMGDAYALGAEYLKMPLNQDHIDSMLKFDQYYQHPRHGQKTGAFSDDGEMSCANANVLINHTYPFTPIQFADAWVAEFIHGGRRKGYSRAFQAILEECETGQDLINKVSNNSEKNGACMRAVPLGVLPKVEQVVETAELQASVTHNTPPAIFAAKVVALMSHFALYKTDSFDKLGDFCLEFVSQTERDTYGNIFQTPWAGRVVGDSFTPVSIATVHAAYYLLTNFKTLKEIMSEIINLGGDTDTMAAVTWGVASSRYKYEMLPAFLDVNLEGGNPHTGSAYLRGLGSRLMIKYG